MKKFITGAIAAMALLLGFAACSGDLHENDIQPLYIVGLAPKPKNARLPLKVISDTEQEFTFIYHHAYQMDTGLECGYWSKVPGKISFKITRSSDTGDWGSGADWGGVNDDDNGKYDAVATVLSANAKEYTALNMRGSTGAPTNPGNVFVYDLVEGAKYTLSVSYNSSTNYVGIKIAGEAASGVELALETNQVYEKDDEDAGVKKGDKIVYDLTRAGSVYTYEFIAEKSIADFGFYVKGDAINTNYTAELSKGKGTLQPIVNEKIEASDYIPFPLVKDCKYKIKIDASKGFAAAIEIEAGPMDYLEDGKATIYGNWKYAENFYEVGVNGYSYVFKAENKDLKMKLIRVGGDYTMGWANATISVDNAPVKLTYYAKELETASYIKFTGLKSGSVYSLKFTGGENNSSDMTLAVEKLEEVSIEGCILKGGWNCSWWGGKQFTLTSESTQEYAIQTPETCSEHNGSCEAPTKEWGIFNSDDKTAWRGDDVEFGKRTLLKYVERDATKASNATMKTNFSAGRKYSIKIEQESKDPVDPKVYITITDLGPIEKKPEVSLLLGDKKIVFENISSADGPTDKYTYTFEEDSLESVSTSIVIPAIKYGGDSYASASATTVELKKDIALVKDGKGSITIVIDSEAYKSYTLSTDFTDKASPKLTVTAVERPKYAKVYVAGSAPLTWGLGNEDAMTVSIVAEKAECKNYYYTFTAAATSLDFKVALENGWNDAYSNCQNADGEAKTILDAAPVEFEYANAKNACIEGLTVGEKYTMVIDTSSGKPKVSIVSGADVLFAIGNDDFGKWSWDTPIMMTPVDKGEWKYEFTATNAAAEFKFQTTCGGWHDEDTWNAQKEISVGDDYTEMKYQVGGGANTSATLTVGTKYVLSVKSINGKYNVKIATAE